MADSPSYREMAVSKGKLASRAELYDDLITAHVANDPANVSANVFVATLARKSNQYKVAFGELVNLANAVETLSVEQLLMIEDTFGKMVKPKLTYWKKLCDIEEVENYDGVELEWFRELKDSLRAELISDFKAFIRILDTKAEESFTQQRMRAETTWKLIDYLKPGEETESYTVEIEKKYVRASVLVMKALPPAHPERLGIILALTKFRVVMRNNAKSALKNAELAAKLAKGSIQTLEEGHRAEAEALLKKLDELIAMIRSVELRNVDSKALFEWTNKLVVREATVGV